MDAIRRLRSQVQQLNPRIYTNDRISYMTYKNLVYALRLEQKKLENGYRPGTSSRN